MNNVSMLIDGVKFKYWESVTVTSIIDGIDTFAFSAPFDHDSKEFKEIFKPFSFKNVQIFLDDEMIINGIMVSIEPLVSTSKTVKASGYSLPGALNDCCSPPDSFPLEFNDMNLFDIAEKIIAPFGLKVVSDIESFIHFDRVANKPTQNVLQFLIGLAKQQGFIISNTTKGELLITRPKIGKISAILEQGHQPLTSISANFEPQKYFSSITGIAPVSTGSSGGKFTIKNSLLSVVRPHTFSANDSEGKKISLDDAVNSKIARMFGNMVSYSAGISEWRSSKEIIYWAGQTVSVLGPDAMIYKPYLLLIKSATLTKTKKSMTSALQLMLPNSFDLKIPESLPWDD